MERSLHGSVSDAEAASEAQLPQEASATLGNVLHHPALRDTETTLMLVRWEDREEKGPAVMSQSATDPSQQHCINTRTLQQHTDGPTQKHCLSFPTHHCLVFFSFRTQRRPSLTSMSVWKLNKSIFCQLLPSRARTFHA